MIFVCFNCVSVITQDLIIWRLDIISHSRLFLLSFIPKYEKEEKNLLFPSIFPSWGELYIISTPGGGNI